MHDEGISEEGCADVVLHHSVNAGDGFARPEPCVDVYALLPPTNLDPIFSYFLDDQGHVNVRDLCGAPSDCGASDIGTENVVSLPYLVGNESPGNAYEIDHAYSSSEPKGF